MQRKLNQKLSAVLRAQNQAQADDDHRRRPSSNSKSSQQRRRELEQQRDQDIDEETPQVSPQPEYDDRQLTFQDQDDYVQEVRSRSSPRASGTSLGRPRSPVAGSRNSQNQDFQNDRLGAFLPGTSASAVPSPRRSSIDRGQRSGSNGLFGSSGKNLRPQDSKGFVLEDEAEDQYRYEDFQEDGRTNGGGWSLGKVIRPEVEDEGHYHEDEDEAGDVEEEEERNVATVTKSPSSPRRNRSSKLAPQPPLRKSSSSKSSKSGKSKERLSGKDKTPSNSSLRSKKQSKTKLTSSTNNNLARKSSLKKVPLDLFDPPSDVNSVSSFINPMGLAGSSSSGRLPPPPSQNSYAIGSRGSYDSRSASREVTALPIEIPENVTDEDAFRRYLTVRRGANTDIRPHIDFEDDQPSYESVGGGGPSRMPAAMVLNSKLSHYQMGVENNKRTSTLSYAIMTLALLSASASQLRFLVRYSKAHSYPVLNYFLICTCIIIEIVVGVGYVVLSRFNFSEERVELIQSYLIAGLFVVAIANVIIAAFAFDDHVCEILAKQSMQIQPETFDTVDQ